MKVKNNKIIKATTNELFNLYLKRGYDDIMSFKDYVERCKELGTLVDDACCKIDALEKQIPQKPFGKEYVWAICPNCGGSISKDNVKEHIFNGDTTFCEHCGQRLDWSEEK